MGKYDCHELESMAKEKGFELSVSRNSHKVLKNKEGRIVVIPTQSSITDYICKDILNAINGV